MRRAIRDIPVAERKGAAVAYSHSGAIIDETPIHEVDPIQCECASVCDIEVAREAACIKNRTCAFAVEGHAFAMDEEMRSAQPVSRAFGEVQF